MRIFLSAILVLTASHFAWAQSDFEAGTFRLKSSPAVRRSGLLRAGGSTLAVKQSPTSSVVKYPADDVQSYCLGLRNYVRASGFRLKSPSGWSTQTAESEFVELLDSGSVSLLRYEYPANAGFYGAVAIYLLQRAGEGQATAIPYNIMDGAGKNFREVLAPYVTARPDLLALLRAKKITIYNLQTFIHASNYRQPFLQYPMQELVPSSK
jgi:hypothetical protein